MAFAEPTLTAEGLAKQFGRRVLFRDLDLSLGPGESIAITGPNGSGKSTLTLMLAGLLSPTAGRIELHLDGRAVPAEERPLHVGFVGPYVQLYEDFSPRENLSFLATARSLTDSVARVDRLVEQVGLAGRGDDLLKTFSSGMKQRVRFAAALLPEPAILLLDEPGSNLDAEGRAFVRQLTASHLAAGGAVALATNAEEEAALCRERIELGLE